MTPKQVGKRIAYLAAQVGVSICFIMDQFGIHRSIFYRLIDKGTLYEPHTETMRKLKRLQQYLEYIVNYTEQDAA